MATHTVPSDTIFKVHPKDPKRGAFHYTNVSMDYFSVEKMTFGVVGSWLPRVFGAAGNYVRVLDR